MTQPARIPLRMLLLIGSLTIFGPLCIDLYLPALPIISHDLHASASEVQLSLTSVLVGLAVGQGVVGPISDRLGRRRPLFIGLIAFIVASVACALSPNVPVLIGLRFIQGLGGSAGVVIARAIVRDLYSGPAAARFFSALMLITGLGPILAPQIGAGLLHLGPWPIQFVILGVMGVVLLSVASVFLPETLPPARRRADGLAMTARTMKMVITDRNFLVNALAAGLGYGAIFGYIAASSFVLENVYGLSPQLYAVTFAVNAVGLVIGSQLNGRLVGRFGSRRLMTLGLIGLAGSGAGVLIVVLIGGLSVWFMIVFMFLLLFSNGLVSPNAMALALNDFPHAAGSASALAGILQYAIGAAAAPLVGLGGSDTAVPMAIVWALFGGAAITIRLALDRAPEPVLQVVGDPDPAPI